VRDTQLLIPGSSDAPAVRRGTARRSRLLVAALAFAVVTAGCGTGPAAPPVGDVAVACAETVCVAYPQGWEILETGSDFIRFHHPSAPETALATVGTTNMRGVVEEAGGTWPAPPDEAARALWTLLEETGAGEYGGMSRLGGAIRTFGTYGSGRMWFLLVPLDSERAIGVEVRGPNRSWETHADVFFSQVVPVP